jgi:hypothetical protein
MANAATITAVGVRREMPERAVVIALATALQESKLENLEDGDRDSLGLFQQRPSQGWGRRRRSRIRGTRPASSTPPEEGQGLEDMRVTDAAQRVQRSAYPNAYEKWADESAVLAKALTGRRHRRGGLHADGEPALRGAAAAAALLKGCGWTGARAWPARRAAVRPHGRRRRRQAGWRYAHWLVSHAAPPDSNGYVLPTRVAAPDRQVAGGNRRDAAAARAGGRRGVPLTWTSTGMSGRPSATPHVRLRCVRSASPQSSRCVYG